MKILHLYRNIHLSSSSCIFFNTGYQNPCKKAESLKIYVSGHRRYFIILLSNDGHLFKYVKIQKDVVISLLAIIHLKLESYSNPAYNNYKPSKKGL